MICPLGLEELRTVVYYELMNLQTLIVATRTNQILLDNTQRYLAELDLFSKGIVVANPVFDYFIKLSGSNLLEQNLKKLHVGERSMLLAKASSKIGEVFYNIISRKNRNRNLIEKHFSKHRVEIVQSQEKLESQLRKLRTFRLSLCQDYCLDVLADVYGDALKLQLLNDCDQLRKRSYLLPKESLFFEIGPGDYGEFQCVNYQQESIQQQQKIKIKFLDKNKRKIKRYWKIPSNKEILKLQNTYDQVKSVDLKHLYQFEIISNPNGIKTLSPNFKKNNQHKILLQRMPNQKLYENKDFEMIYKEKHRFVDFKSSYSYQNIPNYSTSLQGGHSPHLLSVVKYFKSIQNLLDLELFSNKIGSHAQTLANLERNVLCGLPFWEEGDEALFDSSNNQNDDEEEDNNSKRNDKDQNQKKNYVANIGYKNELSKFVIERIAQEKKNKLTLHQELESVKDRFSEFESMMNKLELNDDIDKAAEYLNDQAHLNYYGLVSSISGVQDYYLKEADFNARKELLFINDLFKQLSHMDDMKVTYTNGYHVNTAFTKTNQLCLDENQTNQDYSQWARSAQPVIDENALAPTQFTLVEQMFGQNCKILQTFKKGRPYMGKLQCRDYEFLDFSMINVDQNIRKYIYNNLISVDSQLREYLKIKFSHEDSLFIGNLNQYFDLIFEKKQYLKTLLKSRQLKRIVMILLGNKPLPIDLTENLKLQQVFQEDVQWKINARWDEYQINKIKRQEQEQTRRIQQQKQSLDAGSINLALRKQDQMVSNVISQLDLAQVEIEILSNEIQRFLISSSYRMLDMETSALTRAFEVNGKLLEFYIHPCQQFASTRDQKVDKRNHLDIINKVSFAQRFLTQIKNRCLEIETITSGLGMVISQKDLNECLDEACRSIVKQGEVEMRTRCETFAMQQIQYENMIYIKDRQLLNMEEKLKHAKRELDKIIRTKVFSKGNQLVYELDTCTRQLRMIKDNIYEMEKKLSDKIRLEFDRELDQRTLELDECKRKFADFQQNVNARVMADVRENVNNIDTLMKNKADMFKDLSKNTPGMLLNQTSTTININNLTIKNITTQNSFQGDSNGDNSYFQRMMREYEVLKQSEGEARHEIVKLQEIIRKMRIFDRFKTVLTKQHFENKLDNLRDQLNSNSLLWEQLAEGEKREKILKRELEQSQQEIVTQEKIIEQLKDELKKERGEKQKLIQYRQTKSKRLEELESKAREFEVLQNLNLPKVLNMLEAKEDKIHELKSKDKIQEAQLQQMEKLKTIEMAHFKKKYENEVRIKTEAMTKLETLRHELYLIEGQDQTAIDVWKDKCKKLIEICKSFKDENDKLFFQAQQQTRFQPSQTNTSRRDELNESTFDNELTETSRNQVYDRIANQNIGIGSSYQKKQALVIDKRNTSTVIKEDEKEEHEYTNTQNSVKSSIIATTAKIDYSRNSGNNSSRFKLKKEFSSNKDNKQNMSLQQQVNELNQSIDNPYYTGSQVNMSMVLAGNNGAFTGTQLQNNAIEKINHSFIEPRRDQSFDVSYSKRKLQQQLITQNRGKSFNDKDKISKIAGITSNIFTNKSKKINENGEEFSPPKTPHKQQYEFESHTSSIYGKLTPVYDPKLGQANQNKKNYSVNKQQQLEKSENVFSSLNQGNQLNFIQKAFQGNQLMQTSQENLNDVQIDSKDIFSRNLQIKGVTHQNQLQQKLGLSSNPNLISSSNLNTQISNHTHNQNQSLFNIQNSRMHNASLVTQEGATTSFQTEQKDQRSYSNSVVKSKIVAPPRALAKDLDRVGFKGQVLRKTSQHYTQNDQ